MKIEPKQVCIDRPKILGFLARWQYFYEVFWWVWSMLFVEVSLHTVCSMSWEHRDFVVVVLGPLYLVGNGICVSKLMTGFHLHFQTGNMAENGPSPLAGNRCGPIAGEASSGHEAIVVAVGNGSESRHRSPLQARENNVTEQGQWGECLECPGVSAENVSKKTVALVMEKTVMISHMGSPQRT